MGCGWPRRLTRAGRCWPRMTCCPASSARYPKSASKPSSTTAPGWRGTRPTAVNHNAYVTTDSEATRHFYEDIIGLPLIATWTEEDQMADRVRTYCHTLYGLDDGSALAFFQWLDPDAETVIINSGDGLKTLDAVSPTLPALTPIRPTLAEFAALEAAAGQAGRA